MVLKKKHTSLEEFINQGAPVIADNKDNKERSNFTLRMRKDILEHIGQAIEDRIGISRTAWILEAIQEKLKRTNNE